MATLGDYLSPQGKTQPQDKTLGSYLSSPIKTNIQYPQPPSQQSQPQKTNNTQSFLSKLLTGVKNESSFAWNNPQQTIKNVGQVGSSTLRSLINTLLGTQVASDNYSTESKQGQNILAGRQPEQMPTTPQKVGGYIGNVLPYFSGVGTGIVAGNKISDIQSNKQLNTKQKTIQTAGVMGSSILNVYLLGLNKLENAARAGIETVTPEAQSAIKNAITKFGNRTVERIASGYGFDVSGNLEAGKTKIKDIVRPGLNTALFPAIGAVADVGGGVVNRLIGKKSTPPIQETPVEPPKNAPQSIIEPNKGITPNIEWKVGVKPSQQFDVVNNKSIITLPKNTPQETVWHEVAHAVDRQKPELRIGLADEIKTITGKDYVNNESFADAFKKIAKDENLKAQAPKIAHIMENVELPKTITKYIIKEVQAKDSFTTSKFYKGDSESRYGRTINSSKINTTEDVQQLHQDLNDRYVKLFQDVKGGVKPNEVVRKEAEALGWNIDKIKSIPQDAMLNDAQTVAAHQIKANLTLELAETAKAYEQAPSAELKGKMNDLVSKILYTESVVKRSETYLGRAIQAKTVTPIPKEFDNSIMDILEKAGIGDVKDLGSALKVGDKITKATLNDLYWSVYYNSILSGTTTHFKNFLDTGFNTIIEQGLEMGRHPLNIINQLKSIKRGINTGIIEAGDIFTGKKIVPSKYIPGGRGLTNKLIGKFEVVGRALSAEDAFWRNVNSESSLSSLAWEQARKDGLSPTQALLKHKEYLANPTPEMIEQSVRESLRNTYNQNPEGWVGAVANGWGGITQKIPILRWIQPFSKIVGNVLNAGIDWTPLGLKRAIEYGKSGRPFASREMQQQIGRAVAGTIGMGIVGLAYADGHLTGSGPSNTNQRKQLEATGWQANSFKIGNKYYSYANLGAWGIPLALVANYMDAKKYESLDNKELDKRVAYAFYGALNTIMEKSFISNIKQIFDAIRYQDVKYPKKFISGVVTAPYPNILKQIGSYFNDEKKDPQTFYDFLKNSMNYPFNKKVPAKLDIFGEPTKDKRSILGRIIGTNITPEQNNQISDILNNLTKNDLNFTVLTKSTKIKPGKNSRTMTDDELRQYQIIYGKNLKQDVLKNAGLLKNSKGDNLEKKVNEIKTETTKKSKEELLRKLKLRK